MIGQDKIIDQGDYYSILKHEIEFPKSLKNDERPTLPVSGSGQLPEPPEIANIDPTRLMREFVEFPPMPTERERIPMLPAI